MKLPGQKVIALTRVMARDEETIMVNAVDPGYCKVRLSLSTSSRLIRRVIVSSPVSLSRKVFSPGFLTPDSTDVSSHPVEAQRYPRQQ